MGQSTSVTAIEALGFTRVESEVYVHLLQHAPATGYAVAKSIGRTQGATYKTLASLADRGAVEVHGGQARLYRAVPARELLDRLEREFRRQKQDALEAMQSLEPAGTDDRMYRLTTPEQVYERSRAMLAGCAGVAVLDLFPEPLALLRPDIAAAARRGVKILLLAYAPVDLPGVRVTVPRESGRILEHLPMQWLSIFCDGRESLIAALANDGQRVYQAAWTASVMLSWIQASYAKWSLLAVDLIEALEEGASAEDLRELVRRWTAEHPSFASLGYQELVARYGLQTGGSERRPS